MAVKVGVAALAKYFQVFVRHSTGDFTGGERH
jgi:hypothetical protein